ncbi:GLI pathogenesis-related 2 isoform X1 [Salvelinus alpinus]|uniref:GLI pathogenesis-related 2 isoform X1 n=4 Tax=Salvelinus TaxID=8033 RepID=UPI0039FBD76B
MALRFAVQRKNKTMTDCGFEREFVDAHNDYRRKHGAPPLALSRDLCNSAQKWADHLLSIKSLKHSSTNHGENLYYAYSSTPKKPVGKDAVDSWYSEIKDYHFNKPGFSSGTGHFTQVVWKDCSEVGVGLATDGQTMFVVGQYHPAGNMCNAGYFEKNVLPLGSSTSSAPKCFPTAGRGGGLSVLQSKIARSSSPAYKAPPQANGTVQRKNKTMTDCGFEREFVDAHNDYRRKHGAPPLALSRDLCNSAQKWADHLLSIKSLKHSSTNHGENLYYAYSSTPKKPVGKDAVDSWYSEIKDYHFNKPGFSSGTGHFTQVVWKDCSEVGVGLATDGQTIFVVGQYHPAGNMCNAGYFEKNVLPLGSSTSSAPKCFPTAGKGGGLSVLQSKIARSSSPAYKAPPQANGTDLGQFHRDFLRACNNQRMAHGAPALTLDPALSQGAQAWAETLLGERVLKNSSSSHGENIWAKTGSAGITATGQEVVDAWYKQEENYDFSKPGHQDKTGQFTQLVWRSSKEVGVGMANGGTGMLVVVAHFKPAGNISNPGYHAQNVMPKGSKVTDKPVEVVTSRMQALAVNSLSDNELGQFGRALLKSLNQYRSQHGALPLVLSPALTREAQDWAAHLVSINTLMNSGKGHGENIFYCSGSSTATPTGSDVAESWYKEIEKYNFSSPGFQSGAGNFTQMVWKSAKQVGVGLATSGRGTFIAVAFYDPAGNITNPGYFHDNVKTKGSTL